MASQLFGELRLLWNIFVLRRFSSSLMHTSEYLYFGRLLLKSSPCNLLVFGLGNDSPLWHRMNKGGTSVFLEDNEEWISIVRQKTEGRLRIHHVAYSTRIEEWQSIADNTQRLTISNLPSVVSETAWDVILVDAPVGHTGGAGGPGRMQSIYTASVLARSRPGPVSVLVHDAQREVETFYCRKYLGEDILKWREKRLDHYVF